MTTQTFLSARFGQIEFSHEDVLVLADGMIGFPEHKEYVLIEHREGSPFRWMQSVSNADLAFLVVNPNVYVPEYAPEVPISAVADLELSEATPQLVYTVVNIPKGKPEEMTLNLAGPIVINAENRKARQLVLEDSRFSLRHRAIDPGEQKQAA